MKPINNAESWGTISSRVSYKGGWDKAMEEWGQTERCEEASIQLKPPPPEATWLAQDNSGKWWYYSGGSIEHDSHKGRWYPTTGSVLGRACITKLLPDYNTFKIDLDALRKECDETIQRTQREGGDN